MSSRAALRPMLAVAAAGLLWGLWWLPLRRFEAAGLTGDWASVVLYLVALVILVPFMLVRRQGLLQGGWYLLWIGLCYGTAFSLWNHGLIIGSVVRVTLLFYLAPVWATLLGIFVLGDRLQLLRLLSILSGLGGAFIILGLDGGLAAPPGLADWMALISGFLFAIAATCARKAPVIDSVAKTFASFALATVAAGIMLLLWPVDAAPSLAAVTDSLPSAALCMLWLIPITWMVLWGAAYLDPGRVSILLLLEIVAAAVSSSLLTDEPFGWREAAGCLLVLGAGLLEGFSEMRGGATAPPGEAEAPPIDEAA
jgi:drug/metabolite transporter (DMT)-like permease